MPQASLNYYQSVNVAKVKTDLAPFTSIQAAVDAITDNAAGKRYLVRVHPGTYTEKIIMEDYIDLVAVGGREETIISFTATAHDEPTLTAENSLIKGFTIISDGNTGTFRTRAVSAATAGFEMEDCILTVTNSVGGTDVCLNASASCDIRDCVVDSTGASVTGALFTTGAATYNVARCTFDGATDAIQETTTPTLNLEDCTIADNFNQDGGTANIRRCRIEAVALGTAACTVVAEMTTFSAAFATADAFAHTITCTKCSFSGQSLNNAATGATTINLRDCDGINTLTNAGVAGTVNLYDCGVETLTTTQGTIVAYGGRINACGGSTGTSFVWWKDTNRLNVISSMRIADALTAAGAGDVICLMPGTYAESNLTLKASVNLVGTDSTQCIIAVSDAGNAILNAAVSCTIHNLTVSNLNAGAPAIAVTANSLIVQNCIINGTAAGDAITMVAGTLSVYGTTIGAGDINLSTAICTLNMYGCRITTDPIDTAGAFAHVLTFEHCDFGAQAIASAATGATVITARGCTNVGAITHAGTGALTIDGCSTGAVTVSGAATTTIGVSTLAAVANNSTGTMTINESSLGNLTQAAAAGTINAFTCKIGDLSTGATGTIRLNGGCLFTDIAANAGTLTWKLDPNRVRVVAGTANMKIADALTLAAAGDTILIGQGTFAESNLTMVTGIDLVGEGFGLSVVETLDNANPIVAVGNNIACELHKLKVSNTGTGGAIHIEPVANTSTVTLEDCWVTNSGAGDAIVASIGGAGLATLNARRCDLGSNAAASIVVLMQTAGAGTLTFNSWDCNFATSGGATNAAIEASAAVVADVNVYRATFATCTLAVYCTGANHTVDIEDAEFNNTGVELAANAPTVTLTKCNGIGAFTHSTASTVTMRDSYASGAYTTGAVAAILSAYHCQFGAVITHAGTGTFTIETCLTSAILNNGTATMNINTSTVGAITQAAVAGIMYLTNCKIGDITTGATGTIRLQGQCYFTDIAVNAGVLTWKVDPNHIKVVAGTANMKVADALTLAAAGDVIEIYPGTYAESNLTLKASVNLVGTDPDQCLIVAGDAANAILNAAVSCTISNLTIGNSNAGHPAIEVTANTLTVRDCYVYGTGAGDAIAMLAGALTAYDTRVGAGDINLSTAICNLTLYRCQITTDPIDTAGAFAHTITASQCDFQNQNIASAATLATTLSMRGCTRVGTVTNAGTGAFNIWDSNLADIQVSNAAGSAVIRDGSLNACGASTGSVIWKTAAQQYEVIAGMSIQHAITAAAADTPAPADTAPYTVLVHPGIYTGALTVSAYVNIMGIGPTSSVVVQVVTGIIINLNASCDLQNFTVRSVTPAGGFPLVINETSVVTSRISGLIVEVTTPGAFALSLFSIRKASTITIERCYANMAGTGVNYGIDMRTEASTISLVDNDFTVTSPNAFHFYSNVAATINVSGGSYAGACALLSTPAAGTFVFQGCNLSATAAWSIASAASMTFRNCYIGGTVKSASGSIVYLENCIYHAISRTGTGDLVDISNVASDMLFHVVKMPVETLDNLATRLAVGGAATLGGSGQLRLRINDNAVDAAGIENNADAAGALDSSFTAGYTPRYVRQISVGAFRATTTMFFGLRATVGAAVPAAAEDHCGFIWTGAAFNASSSDGAGVGVTTALTTPSTGAQHQLEVIQFRSKVAFYVDGVLVATHTGVGIPTAAGTLDFQDYEISSGAGGATTSDITIRAGFCQECPA